jgi:hypothetical protein
MARADAPTVSSYAAENLDRRVLQRHPVALAGVVDHDVEATERGRAVLDGALRRGGVGDVELLDVNGLAVLGGEVIEIARIPRCRDHAVAGGERLLGDLAAEPPGRAGHEEHLVHRNILTFRDIPRRARVNSNVARPARAAHQS